MRSPSCCRTPSAVVHSLAPLLLAEAAVIGTPAARMISTGIFAAGIGYAILTELAATFPSPREEAPSKMGAEPASHIVVFPKHTPDIGTTPRQSALATP